MRFVKFNCGCISLISDMGNISVITCRSCKCTRNNFDHKVSISLYEIQRATDGLRHIAERSAECGHYSKQVFCTNCYHYVTVYPKKKVAVVKHIKNLPCPACEVESLVMHSI